MADDLHTLSAPYALDALTPDERAQFEEHLSTCDRCREELAGLQDTAASLAFAVEGPAPPTARRAAILDAARAERPNVVPLRPRRTFTAVAAAFAVAASVAAVGFGVWAASLHNSLSSSRDAVRVLGDPESRHLPVGGSRGELVVAPSGQAVLAVRLPKLPSGKTYEAWIASPSVKRAGQFDGTTFTLPRDVRRGEQVMVTVERSGGVDAPTSKPLLAVRV
ncbi:MAG: anti-sigma factor domain-containing protein [Gaiellaceae bacterium]